MWQQERLDTAYPCNLLAQLSEVKLPLNFFCWIYNGRIRIALVRTASPLPLFYVPTTSFKYEQHLEVLTYYTSM